METADRAVAAVRFHAADGAPQAAEIALATAVAGE
jgi:hypothetical protein